jgi:C1A family cysteine protease
MCPGAVARLFVPGWSAAGWDLVGLKALLEPLGRCGNPVSPRCRTDKGVFLMEKFGWIPDLPDNRDYTEDHPDVGGMISSMIAKSPPAKKVDLRPWCSKVEDQGNLGSCTAHAGTSLIEFFENKAYGKYLEASRLFLYRVTRKLLFLTGDSGATIRGTMSALVQFGAPDERYWKYTDGPTWDDEPPTFVYGLAANYQVLRYYRLDPAGSAPDSVLDKMKKNLALRVPMIIGFSVYSSIRDQNVTQTGKIPFPQKKERLLGGHAVLLVGYDDSMKIGSGKSKTTGAFLLKNSWGTNWGEDGYGYLPYQYVLGGLAEDFWTLIKAEWIDTTPFDW